MASQDKAATFSVVAKDAASSVLRGVGKEMGRLGKTGGAVFKTLAVAAAAVASAIAATAVAAVKFTQKAIQAAIQDDAEQQKLIATLKARGLTTEEATKRTNELIAAGQKLAFTDSETRKGLGIASQYTKNYAKQTAILTAAQNLSRARNISLEAATKLVGKAFSGNGKSLKAYGVDLTKTTKITETKTKKDKNGWEELVTTTKVQKDVIKGMEALNLITAKFGGIADEVAGTTGVKLQAAFIRFNEAIETFGAKLLPMVNEALTFLTEKALPAFEGLMETLGPVVGDLVDNYVRPLVDSIGELFAVFDTGEGSINLLTIALAPLKLALEAIKFVIDAIVAGMKFIGIGAGNTAAKNLESAAASAGYGGGSFINPMNRTGAAPTTVTSNTNLYLDGRVIAKTTNTVLGSQTNAATGSRTSGR